MRKGRLLMLGLLLLQVAVNGQGLSLKQCIEYANKNNGNIKNAHYDVDIAQKKIDEQVGTMLPQVDASGSYTDNLKLNTTLLPGELMGKPGTMIPITMGIQHNLMTGIALNQKIYDPSFKVALQAAKVSQQQSIQSLQKTNEQTAYNISRTYYQTLVIQKQMNVLKATLDASEKSLASLELKFQNGMAKKVDVDKIKVSRNNTRSQLDQSQLSYKQSLNNLKYQMGMPVENAIELVETELNQEYQPIELKKDSFNVENRVDYQLQKTALQLYEIDKKRNQAGYLPTFSFNAAYNYNAMRKEFNFLDMSQKWFNSSSIGFTLKVPIFDGFQKRARIAQSSLNIEKSRENINLTEQSIKVDISNYEIQYSNALDNIRNERENLDLANSVYKNTQLAYQQGTGSSLDLVQAESSLREAQNNYFNKLLSLYIARIDLEQSKGTLMTYINNLK
ncbi:MAG: TolC family protein [Bacteroidota bacterium]|nr:TolC family protein [Bacteroidota bacterium]